MHEHSQFETYGDHFRDDSFKLYFSKIQNCDLNLQFQEESSYDNVVHSIHLQLKIEKFGNLSFSYALFIKNRSHFLQARALHYMLSSSVSLKRKKLNLITRQYSVLIDRKKSYFSQ